MLLKSKEMMINCFYCTKTRPPFIRSHSMVMKPLPCDPSTSNLPVKRFRSSRDTRVAMVHSSMEPAGPASTGPPFNSASWFIAIVVGVVVPFINYKWGPSLWNKIEAALKITEEVVEAVEVVAEEVEKVAEDIAKNLPEGGKLREEVDFVESLAKKAAKDAGILDEFINRVQQEEEKLESLVDSFKDQSITSSHQNVETIIHPPRDELPQKSQQDQVDK